MVLTTAVMCLAMNIYAEARGETILGQYGVALVTMNRAHSKDRVCEEVFKRRQFSWANSGVYKTKNGWVISKRQEPKDAQAWWVANRVAVMTLSGKMFDITKGATHYHATYVSPDWSKVFRPTKRLGRHIFYAFK